MDNGALQATGILNIIVQTLNAEQAKQALNNINQRLQNVNRTASKMGPSFRRGIIGVFYMRQALRTVTNAVKEFGAGNDLLAEKLDTVGSTISDATLGYMVMSNAIKGSLGSWVGLALAVARVTATIITWRKHMMEAAAGVISKYSTVNNTLKKIAEATSDLEVLANYMKLVKNYGEEGAIALLKMGEVDFETLVRNSEIFQKNLLEILKDSEVGRRILKETATTQKIAITDTTAGLEDQVEIIQYNVIPAWRKFKRELNLGEFGTVIANIQSLNKGLDDFYTKLYGYRAPTPKGVGTEEWEKEQEKLKDIEQYLEEKKAAEHDFYQELLKLRGQDFEAFKLDLKEKIDEYSKYITNKKLLEEYYNRSIQQYLEEQERERKEFINRVVSADVEAINRAVEEKKRKEQEFLEEQRRQQEEWENYYMQSLDKETEIFVKEQMEQLKQFTQISLRKEEVQRVLYENFKKYAEDYYSSELDTIQQIKEELGLVQETRLDKLLADVQNLPRKVEDIREGYLSLLKTDFSPLEQDILDIIQAHDEWVKRTGDVELAEKITNATLRQLYSDYAQERINLQQEILDSEENLQERIKELTTDEYDYRIRQLELQADKYREFGLSQLTVEKWLYLEKKKLWEEEVESYREKEERKREIEQDARQRYEEFMMKVKGESERLKISGYVSSVQSLIKQLWESLPQSEAIGKITSIISSFNQYVKQQLGEQITQNPQLWEQYIYEGQLALQRYFLQLQQPIKLPEELAKKKPREPEWTNLSDQVKDVTASTQEFWGKVEEVKKKWGEVNKQVADIEKTIRDKLILVLGEVEEETRKKINDLIAYMQSLSDDWFRVGESSGEKFGEGFYNGVVAWGNRIGQAIADYIAFKSPPKKGPLSDADKYGYRFILMFLQSMAQATPTMTEQIDTFFKPLSPEQLFKRMATKWQPPKDFLELKEFDLFENTTNRVLDPDYIREWVKRSKTLVASMEEQAQKYRSAIYQWIRSLDLHRRARDQLQNIAKQRPLTTLEQQSLEHHIKAIEQIEKHIAFRQWQLDQMYKREEKYKRAIEKRIPIPLGAGWATGSQGAYAIKGTVEKIIQALEKGDVMSALKSFQIFGTMTRSVSSEDLVRIILLAEKEFGKKLPAEFVKLAIPLIQARGAGLEQLVQLPKAQMAGSQIKEYLEKVDFNEIIQKYAKGQPITEPLAWLASRYGFILPIEGETHGEEITRVSSSSYSPTGSKKTSGGIVINIYNNIEKIEGIQDISILKEAVVESVLNALYRLGYS